MNKANKVSEPNDSDVGDQSLVTRFWRWWVVRNYTKAGLEWGDAQSYYGMLGPCVGHRSLCNRLDKWQARYQRLGFRPVQLDTWVKAGGYGKPFVAELFQIESE